jgi:outer membrane scaffolding protein for murein synthesis (MipA/OmpV family)
MRAFLVALVLALTALASGPAVAQDYEQLLAVGNALRWQSLNPWKVNLGIGFGFASTYPYSRDEKLVLLPLIDVEWRDVAFVSTQRGVGFNWIRTGNVVAGMRVTYDWGRQTGDDAFLRGTDDVNPTAEVGFFWMGYAGPWRLNADLRYGLSGHNGIRGAAGIAHGTQLAANASIFVGLEAHFASTKYNFAYFEVVEHGVNDVTTYLSLVRDLRNGAYLGLDGRFFLVSGPAGQSNLSAAYGHAASVLVGRRF